jgi:hypothetical protein
MYLAYLLANIDNDPPSFKHLVVEALSRQVHGDDYEYPYDETIYTDLIFVETKIPIICKTHGLFYLTLREHLIPPIIDADEAFKLDIRDNYPHGCLTCINEIKNSNARRRLTTSMFLMQLEQYPDSLKVDYSLVRYGIPTDGSSSVDSDGKRIDPSSIPIALICRECSTPDNKVIYYQRPYIHIKGFKKNQGTGCKECHKKLRIEVGKRIWEDEAFRKSKTEATRIQMNDPIMREKLRSWMTERNKDPEFRKLMSSEEVRKNRSISNSNFDRSTPSDVYLLTGYSSEFGYLIKVGCSSNIHSRLANLKVGNDINFELIWSKHFENGIEAFKLEDFILNNETILNHKWNGDMGSIVRKGSTEILTFSSEEERSKILNFIIQISDTSKFN